MTTIITASRMDKNSVILYLLLCYVRTHDMSNIRLSRILDKLEISIQDYNAFINWYNLQDKEPRL